MGHLPESIEVYLSLGTNLGDREGNLNRAVEVLDTALGTCHSGLSGFHETDPWGFESNAKFLNAAVVYRLDVPRGTDMPLFGKWLLGRCKEIEVSMGRTGEPEYDSAGKRIYRSRIIDIDILLIGDSMIDMPELKVPHPLMGIREFVMVPLMEIASDSIKGAFPCIFSAK
ncbi:MAG: 2-amino-4-hydroxy-6-hydroxymethyldihydropteridine diphosphokinase [Clostridium sp.]|nr:2-amino-4-hydroxy-6-hydroxymethyldihydropteridine diphosphokinase [Clostridium sp.]